MNLLRKSMALALVLAMVLFSSVPPSYARTTLASDSGHLGNDKWSVTTDGDLVPNSNTYTIGDDTYYPASISLGGVEKTSWGSIVSPMTDATDYTYPTDSGALVRLYDTGYITLGGDTAVDCYILFDGYVDTYIGIDDTDDSLHIGYGGTMGTTDMLTFPAARTFIVGDGTTNDFGFYFDGNGADFSIGMDDTGGEEEDLFCISIGSAVATTPELSIGKGSGMVYVNSITSPGTADLDIGESGVTDVTVVTDGGTIILDGTITLTDGEIISNATDDTVRVASNDLDTILEVYTAYDTNGDATLKLSADVGDAAGEQWTFTSTGATTDLVIGCDDSSSGTPITRFTISDAGVVTTVGTVNLEIEDAGTSSVTDVLNVQHFTSGTAAAGYGVGLTFDIENGSGTEEEHASIDIVSTTATDAAEDTDLVVNLMSAGALAEVFRIVAASSGTVGDSFTFTSNTTETDAVTDIISLANVTGTAEANTGLGITWDFEDASGAEEQASLDVVLIDETNATEDADFIFSQQSAGVVTETLRIVGTQSSSAASNLKFTGTTTETNGVVDILTLVADVSADDGSDNLGLGISIHVEQEDAATPIEQASIDFVMVESTTATEDCDVVFSQATAGAVAETLRLVANSSATTSDYLQFTANTTETTVCHPVLVLATATGTAADLHGTAISFRPEDATGSEEHARIDVIQTTAARATNDTDFVFTQDIAGTLTETVRFDADASLGGVVVIEGASPLALGGTTDDAYFTIVAVADAASSSKTVTLPSITSSIALETVATTAITAHTTAAITVVPGTDTLYTYTIDTDNENCTLTFSAGGTAGDIATIIFITDAAGSADEVMTFDGTLSDAEGTLTLANGASKRYVMVFISDGTIWNEISRTAVLG